MRLLVLEHCAHIFAVDLHHHVGRLIGRERHRVGCPAEKARVEIAGFLPVGRRQLDPAEFSRCVTFLFSHAGELIYAASASRQSRSGCEARSGVYLGRIARRVSCVETALMRPSPAPTIRAASRANESFEQTPAFTT